MTFENIHACVFDAYGTLFDVHTPVSRLAAQIGEPADALSQLWRQKQLEYTWLRSLMGAHADFWQVTGEALDYAMTRLDIQDSELRDGLMAHYLALDAYSDAAPALTALRAGGRRTAILSNGNPHMLKSAVSSAGLDEHLDDLISVEEAGIYKPHASVYQLAVDRMGVEHPAHICFVSANTWDVQGGAHFGFTALRIERAPVPDDNIPGAPLARITSLEDLPALIA